MFFAFLEIDKFFKLFILQNLQLFKRPFWCYLVQFTSLYIYIYSEVILRLQVLRNFCDKKMVLLLTRSNAIVDIDILTKRNIADSSAYIYDVETY